MLTTNAIRLIVRIFSNKIYHYFEINDFYNLAINGSLNYRAQVLFTYMEGTGFIGHVLS
jgi:hypothetical protein